MSIESVVIGLGQSHRFALQSNAGTGYVWLLDTLPAGAWVEGIEDTAVPSVAVGGPTIRTFTLFGGRVGHGTLRFVLARPWEPISIVDHREFAVRVERGTPIVPLYAATLHQAIAGGDLAHLTALAAQAEEHVSQTPEIQSALVAAKAEILKLGGGKFPHPVPLYATPIHHAIAGGDLVAMKQLAAQADAQADKSPEVVTALAALKAAIAKAGG